MKQENLVELTSVVKKTAALWAKINPNKHIEIENDSAINFNNPKVVVYFYLPKKEQQQRIYIDPNCFIIDFEESNKIDLLAVENIAVFPDFTEVSAETDYQFTLTFNKLPNNCIGFDILEDVNRETGLFIPHVRRNEKDIYHIHLQ